MSSLPFPLSTLGSDSRRLLHGRGGLYVALEHVAIDWFAPVLLVTLYADKETNSPLLQGILTEIKNTPAIAALVVQKRYLPKAPKSILYGKLPTQVFAEESGLRYHLNLDRNQNHGFFLDMKAGRDWVRSQANGQRVLNLFAYTCSLSVAAIAGGAESVLNLDMASNALSTGRRNHHLNFESALSEKARYLPHDLFKSWGRLVREAPYDLVLIDPPSQQGKSFQVEKDYPKILRRLPELITPQSHILACLNSPHHDESFLTNLFKDYHNLGRLSPSLGFEDSQPAAALKCISFAAG